MIECHSCGIQYVGETKLTLRERFNGHRNDIETEKNTVVAKHFNQLRCEYSDCEITPILQCPQLKSVKLTTDNRLKAERYLISLLKTYSPYGLNIAQIKPKDKDTRTIQYIVPYSGLATKASHIVRKHYTNLHEKMPDVFPEVMITAYKRNKNFRDILVSSQMK